MVDHSTDELQLLKQAVQGDLTSFDKLFSARTPWLVEHAKQQLRAIEDFRSDVPDHLLNEIADDARTFIATFELPRSTKECLPAFERFLIDIIALRLLELAVRRDSRAFDALFSLEEPWLRASAEKLVRGTTKTISMGPEDLTQETAVRAWKSIAEFELPLGRRARLPSFRKFLYRALKRYFLGANRSANAQHLIIEAFLLKPRKDDARLDGPVTSRTPSRAAGDAEVAEEIGRFLESLPDQEHAILWSAAVDEMSYADIASSMGLTNAQVNHALRRAHNKMLKLMASSPLWFSH